MLTENRRFVGQRQLSEHIRRLNGNDPVQRVTTEWEIAVLNGLSKLGQTQHEPTVPGTSKPDVLFTHSAGTVLMDITTVSDRGLDQQNPIDKLANHLLELVRKRNLEPDHFDLSVRGNDRDLYIGGPKARLLIPRERDFDRLIFNDGFHQFLDQIRDRPTVKRTFSVINSEVRVIVTYDPAQRSFSLGYLSYTVAFSIEENAIWRALNEKASQLDQSGLDGTKAIILCDGGCEALNRAGRGGLSLGADDIVLKFLNTHRRIGFVLALLVKDDNGEHLRILAKTWIWRPDSPAAPLATYLHQRLAAGIPNPESNPFSAYGTENEGKSFNGGYVMVGWSIKISSRVVAELLAGRRSQEDFMRDNPDVKQRFDRAISEGRMLAATKIEACPERDDDWIHFKFSEPDAAISRFRKPDNQ